MNPFNNPDFDLQSAKYLGLQNPKQWKVVFASITASYFKDEIEDEDETLITVDTMREKVVTMNLPPEFIMVMLKNGDKEKYGIVRKEVASLETLRLFGRKMRIRKELEKRVAGLEEDAASTKDIDTRFSCGVAADELKRTLNFLKQVGLL